MFEGSIQTILAVRGIKLCFIGVFASVAALELADEIARVSTEHDRAQKMSKTLDIQVV